LLPRSPRRHRRIDRGAPTSTRRRPGARTHRDGNPRAGNPGGLH
jgi:hypothetical protein